MRCCWGGGVRSRCGTRLGGVGEAAAGEVERGVGVGLEGGGAVEPGTYLVEAGARRVGWKKLRGRCVHLRCRRGR